MAACPTCNTSGDNWKHCTACGMYYCSNSKTNNSTNVCLFCKSVDKLERKEPSDDFLKAMLTLPPKPVPPRELDLW